MERVSLSAIQPCMVCNLWLPNATTASSIRRNCFGVCSRSLFNSCNGIRGFAAGRRRINLAQKAPWVKVKRAARTYSIRRIVRNASPALGF